MIIKCSIVEDKNSFYPKNIIEEIKSGEGITLTIEMRATTKGSNMQIFKGNNPYIKICEAVIDTKKTLFLILDVEKVEGKRAETIKKKISVLKESKFFLPLTISEWKDGRKIRKTKILQIDGGGIRIFTTAKEKEKWRLVSIKNVY